MRLLLFAINSLNEEIFYNKLLSLGHETYLYQAKCSDYMFDGEVASQMITIINEKSIDAVVSFDYLPIVSLVCDVCKKPYYSWGYDSPQLTLYAKTVLYPYNKIAVFDRKQAEFLSEIGYENIHHIPLAVDADEFSKRIAAYGDKMKRFSDRGYSDISFVGSLYTDKRKCNLYDMFRQDAAKKKENLDIWEELDGIISEHLFKPIDDIMYGDVSPITEFLRPYMNEYSMGLSENYLDVEDIITREEILEKKISADERLILMNTIAEYSSDNGMDFALYTSSDTKNMELLNKYNRGIVDYKTEMPVVFNRSKINVNITIRSIHSGIPLRALDVLGCGGFLLTNAQEEITEHFTDGVHLATFDTPEECTEKIEYYLKNDDKRQKIAQKGLELARDRFTYEKSISRLFEI